MADFVLLYRGGNMPETDDEKARVMKAWDGWYSELGGAIKDGGNPFAPAAKTIGTDGKVSDASAPVKSRILRATSRFSRWSPPPTL